MKPETENWLKIARYDLKAAKTCLQNELYLKVFENCHTALEKVIKGIITENQEKEPPKIHNLLKLCSLAIVEELTTEIQKIFHELNNIYYLTRYPKDFDYLEKILSKDKTEDIYTRTEKVFKWLEGKLKGD